MEKEQFTGERFLPGIQDEVLAIEHFQRYEVIRDLIKDKNVLDAACGEGYGSGILSQYAREVIGLDISKDTIERAKNTYANIRNLKFVQGSIANLPLEDGSIDVVVSFETIEHVNEELQNSFITEVKRVLKKDGIFIVSTPNKKIYSDLYNYHNEFHIKEFYEDEFSTFLKRYFKNVKLFYQFFEVAGIIDYKLSHVGTAIYKKSNEYEGEGKYIIALASQENLDDKLICSVNLGKTTNFQNSTQRILTLQEEEVKRNKHIWKLDKEIEEKGNYILQLQGEAEEKDNYVLQLRGEAEEKDNYILQLQGEAEEKDNYVLQLQGEAEERDNHILQLQGEAEERDNHILQLQGEAEERDNHILQLQEEVEVLEVELRNKKGHIEQLLEVEREFEREKQTRSYKFAIWCQKVFTCIVPKGSRREFFLYVLYQCIRHPRLMLRMISPIRIKNCFTVLKKEGMDGVWYYYRLAEDIEKLKLGDNSQLKVVEVDLEKKALEDYSILEFVQWELPLVSIVIPVYNQFIYTYQCLESILKNSGNIKYEVVIGNDCSTDQTQELDKVVRGITIINNEKNLRFLKNCNNAASRAKGKYIVFLNNDTQVQEKWLSSLLDIIEKDETAGIVGSKLVYPDGHLQEAGGIVWRDGSAWNYGQNKMPDDAEYNYVKDVDYISGAAIMIRKSLWEEIGGFDERFAPAYYEDTDLAFEVRKHGYRVVYQPLSVVVHFEGISNGTNVKEGIKAYQIENQKKFYEKWKEVLEKEHFPNAENVFLAKDRSRYKKQILVVDHYVPNYDKDAGGKCTYMYLKTFLKMGMKVTFIGDNFAKMEPYATELNQLGIEILYGNYYCTNWQNWLKNNLRYFDYIYLQRPHISIKYMDIVKEYGHAKVFYFAHDLHHLREYRQYQLDHNPETLRSSEHWKKIEYELFGKADVGHVVGSYEQKIMQKVFPDKPIRNIPLYIYENELNDIEKDFSKRQDIIYVGGFGHPPNEDAVLWFAKEVFPRVLEKYPTMKWHVVGSKVTKAVQALANDNILIEGFQPDKELHRLYRECRIAVVPLRYGAGVKGKVVESAYFQIPLVTTSIGAEGLNCEDHPFVVEDDAVKMAEKICNLYENYDELKELSDRGKVFIQKNFTLEVAKDVLRADINI
jgi:GT2 family glycosyltransferase/ubiquinone/menaquinone biosynthesis C-methylase UbiE